MYKLKFVCQVQGSVQLCVKIDVWVQERIYVIYVGTLISLVIKAFILHIKYFLTLSPSLSIQLV